MLWASPLIVMVQIHRKTNCLSHDLGNREKGWNPIVLLEHTPPKKYGPFSRLQLLKEPNLPKQLHKLETRYSVHEPKRGISHLNHNINYTRSVNFLIVVTKCLQNNLRKEEFMVIHRVKGLSITGRDHGSRNLGL